MILILKLKCLLHLYLDKCIRKPIYTCMYMNRKGQFYAWLGTICTRML